MSLMSVNGDNMDFPFVRGSINASVTTVIPESSTFKVKEEEDKVSLPPLALEIWINLPY